MRSRIWYNSTYTAETWSVSDSTKSPSGPPDLGTIFYGPNGPRSNPVGPQNMQGGDTWRG